MHSSYREKKLFHFGCVVGGTGYQVLHFNLPRNHSLSAHISSTCFAFVIKALLSPSLLTQALGIISLSVLISEIYLQFLSSQIPS